jgi:hypothetical protein
MVVEASMPIGDPVVTTAGELVRQFSHYRLGG